ncbi:MAG: hypothetical protein IJU37_08140 [Desulfovibrio sp.]|nr:hypothetical protein [Desulfovibrio sp.]
MPLDVNGDNAQFKNFVDFANQAIQANPEKGRKSIAQANGTTALGDRTIKVNDNDVLGKWRRSQEVEEAGLTMSRSRRPPGHVGDCLWVQTASP